MITDYETAARRRLARILNAADGKMMCGLFSREHILDEMIDSLIDWQADLGGDATDAGEVT